MTKDSIEESALNAICPYFTMFPLDFPYSILKENAVAGEWVLDPFCGRGTTNYASRILGLPSIGIDSSPVAVALSQAKLANTSVEEILEVASQILKGAQEPINVPIGEFWEWAFHKETLYTICKFREALLLNGKTDAHTALKAILMGALHGPLTKSKPSYLSNQSQRTYAPKPRYAVNFWQKHNLLPPKVDAMAVIEHRAKRYYTPKNRPAYGKVVLGNSQDPNVFLQPELQQNIKWVLTSPPYYGMHTYIPDQWLRMWFVGGKSTVDYTSDGQISHSSPTDFANSLRKVWINTGTICQGDTQMVVRFGGINNRKSQPLTIIKQSFNDTKWLIQEIKSAGFSSEGKRQALHMRTNEKPLEEYDIWVKWHD